MEEMVRELTKTNTNRYADVKINIIANINENYDNDSVLRKVFEIILNTNKVEMNEKAEEKV
jgi:hypothetical protein